MSDEVRSIYEAASRMDAFGAANKTSIAPFSIPSGMFSELKTIKQGLETAGAARSSFNSAGASSTVSKAAVYNSIYRRMRQISRTAAAIKLREPDFENKYILPRSRMPYQEGIERAKAIQTNAAADKPKFLEYLLRESVFDGLDEDLTAFENAGRGQIDARMSSVGETANLDSLIERFMDIHAPLNRMMKNLFADDPEKLAEWRSAARIERRRNDSTGATGNNPPAPTT